MVVPIILENLWNGRYELSASFAVMIALILINGHRVRQGKNPWFSSPVLTAVTVFVQALAVLRNGPLGLFWLFPVIIFFFLVQTRGAAILSSTVLVAAIIPLSYLQVGVPPTVRLLATSVLTILMANTFLGVIGLLEKRLREQARTDPLTGVFNRRHLNECLAEAVERGERHATACSMVVFDLDHFKRVNDELGHDAGDRVLRVVSGLFQARLRSTDLLFRIGGEEFLLLLGDTRLQNAAGLAEELRAQIASARILEDRPVTLSMGVSELRPGEGASHWMSRTDALLYEAKNQGRNQVVAG